MDEKVIGLISGGIDSPVSIKLTSNRFKVIPLYFCLYPLASKESTIKAFDAIEKLKKKISFEKALIFPWASVLRKIIENIEEGYRCVACRKSMFMVGSEIAERENAMGIVTGESVGQKASQTLKNIVATSYNIKNPILRPLIGKNKNEIINLSKDWDLWDPNHSGCCLATPEKPIASADPQKLEEELQKIDPIKIFEENEGLIYEFSSDRDLEEYLFELSARFG